MPEAGPHFCPLPSQVFSSCEAFTECAYKQGLDEGSRSCCEFLHPVFTENGFCYAFNLNHTISDMPGCAQNHAQDA